MKSQGKIFEEDFQKSAAKYMDLYRLRDPAQSFNRECAGCDKQKTRFSPKNISDFVGYRHPNQYWLELKTHKGASIHIKAIVTGKRDKRIEKMAEKANRQGVYSYVIFNWRDHGNQTFAVEANTVLDFINFASRKSIPWKWTRSMGIRINQWLVRSRYEYDLINLLTEN